ncbi:MAG: TOBE domain-containing protein [Candidatus Nanopelagicales bacterium]
MRISEAARLLRVSDDTVRRLVDSGTLTVSIDSSGRKLIDAARLAGYVKSLADSEQHSGRSSARNHLTGIVTGLVVDEVMAQVELQCGPFRVVSLMSSEAVRDLGLEVGSPASAVIKSTNVIIETPGTT